MLNVPAMVDPLAYVPAPTVGPCTVNSFVASSSQTINPGVYCDGIQVKNNSTLTMNPGLYIIAGSGLQTNAGTTIQGTGVTIYNTQVPSGAGYKAISMNGGSTIKLSAPTSGTYEGILFFADRNMAPVLNLINGNNASDIVGALYFPNSYLAFSGNSSTTSYTEIVARTLTITGNATINNDYSSLANGSPIKSAGAMVE